MDQFFKNIQEYCERHTAASSDLLTRLERETHLKTMSPQMLSGPLQGRFLALISRLLQPKRVLEIGTFTGYSAICLAEGLASDGELHTIDIDPEVSYIARQYIREAGLEDRIHLHLGDARAIIPSLEGPFDLVFIDAGKQEYPTYFDLVVDRLRPGGLLLADNVLWSGKVLNPAGDADAQVLDRFNKMVAADERVSTLMLPLRDGLLVARRE